MKLPLISILTPTFNAASSVEKALLSVINQRYKAVEHIFIDGASGDSTTSIIRSYQQQHDHIRLVSEKDKGLYDAINKGMTLCTGDWIYIMGADDELYNDNVFNELVEKGWFQEEQVVYGNVLIRGHAHWAENDRIYDGPFTLEKLYLRNICHQSMFYPRSVINRIGYYSTRYPITADWDYNMHCFANYKFAYTDLIIAIFNGGGKSSEKDEHSFYKDMPDKVIQYFHLDPADKSLQKPDSPFYYPITRYRENEFLKKIRKAEEEIARLKIQLSSQKAEYERPIENLKREQERLLVSLNAELDHYKQKEAEFIKVNRSAEQRIEKLTRALAGKDEQCARQIAVAKRDVENLRTELGAHKRTIESLVNSYTWKAGRLILAPVRFFRRKGKK